MPRAPRVRITGRLALALGAAGLNPGDPLILSAETVTGGNSVGVQFRVVEVQSHRRATGIGYTILIDEAP